MVVSSDGKTLYHIQNVYNEGSEDPYDTYIWLHHSPTHADLVRIVKQEVYSDEDEPEYDEHRVENFVKGCAVYPVYAIELQQVSLTPQEERELALSEARNGICWSDIRRVECDNTGDKWWRWHAKYYIRGELAWENYYHNEPDQMRVYNDLLDSIKEDLNTAHHIAEIVNNN